METTSTLCDVCTQALTIDDKAAGGLLRNASDGTATLDVGNFKFDNCQSLQQNYLGQYPARKEDSGKDEFGWRPFLGGDYKVRETYATQNVERILSPPEMLELSTSSDGTCVFCKRLGEILLQYYGGCPWWQKPESKLRVTMRYEWQEYSWSTLDEKHQAETPHAEGSGREEEDEEEEEEDSPLQNAKSGKDSERMQREESQQLTGLAVFIHHPGLQATEVDVYKFDVHAWPGQCRDWLKIKHDPLDPAGSVSEKNIQFMKDCIHTCVKDHPECKDEHSQTSFIPTRLLDIGTEKSERIWLMTGDQIQRPRDLSGAKLEYATLSYCWGPPEHVPKTTSATKKSHERDGILVSKMPATFQDAIIVARKLDIQYLWIDALCIIQGEDDEAKQDWEVESGRMCNVFAHSHVTISAAASSDASDHFLMKRIDHSPTIHFRSSLKPEVSGDYLISLNGPNTLEAEADIEQSVWRSRAWVWQEEIMSTRQIIFSKKMVQFRCTGTGSVILENRMRYTVPSMHLGKQVDLDEFWDTAITKYSQRALTFPQDKLGAMAGVAKFIQSLLKEAGTPTEYIAGLWLDDTQYHTLAHQLCWVYNEPRLSYREMQESFDDEAKYSAPSWSWASRNTGVDSMGAHYYPASFKVLGYEVRPARSDAMVAISSGSFLLLRGKCQPSPVLPINGVFMPETEETLGRPNSWRFYKNNSIQYEFWLDWVPNKEDLEEQTRQSRLQLFLLSTESFYQHTTGLLLLPFNNPQETVYRRVGVFEFEEKLDWSWDGCTERDVTII